MDIKDITVYKRANIYSHRPVIKMIVDIGEYGNIPTKDIKGFNDRLLKAFPGLKLNTCGLGYEGGFLEKLNNGTYLAHVLEHVILEMQFMLGYDVRYGKTRVIEDPSLYYLVFEYENEISALECSKAAVFILECFINNQDINIDEYMAYLKDISIDSDLGPSTAAIVNEAKKRGIPITRIGHESLIQLNYGNLIRLIESTLTDTTSCIAVDISCNKHLTKSILKEHDIPVPYGKVVYSEISAVMAANNIGMPVVLKPHDGNQGKGVHLNLTSEAQIREAFKEATKFSQGVLIEEYIKGNDYRILVVGDKVSAVALRVPASVIGDGKHTIKELVDIINQDSNRGEYHEKILTKIKLDVVALNVLRKQNLDISSIPKEGEVVLLRENGNLSTGGTAIDCTDIIHPDNVDIAIRAAKAIGIDIAGVDVVTSDISKSLYDTDGAVVEVNAAPGLRMHLYPSKGKPRNVAKDIVDFLYPEGKSSNFPIVSVTGTNGKTTTVRIIAHTLQLMGRNVGYTTTCGSYINDQCISKGDNSGPRSARKLLSNKKIDVCVLETARGGILREGLGYDLADVGVITNISDDHLGIDGVNNLEDLAFVKSLVAEAVKDNGYAVLNGEDEMTDYILERVKTKVILFYNNIKVFNKYKNKDFVHVYTDDNYICIKDSKITKLLPIADIPITNRGIVECNILNSLCAAAALYALNVPYDIIARGLRSFHDNEGRYNLYDMGNYKILLDYAHNRAGYEELIKVINKLEYKRVIGIVGMPGDRSDTAIQEVGKLVSGAFDKIYIKEDINLRNRNKGEVANLLYESITTCENYNSCEIKILSTETVCLEDAISNAKEGDLIVVLYEKSEPLIEIINYHKIH